SVAAAHQVVAAGGRAWHGDGDRLRCRAAVEDNPGKAWAGRVHVGTGDDVGAAGDRYRRAPAAGADIAGVVFEGDVLGRVRLQGVVGQRLFAHRSAVG